jgi:hypothetical protein
MGEESGRHVDSKIPCVNLCVKIFPKLAKMCEIYKNVIIVCPLISIFYCKMRRLESSESLSTNP